VVTDLYRRIKRNIHEDGLIVSSSGFLVDRMLSRVDFSRPLKILEIGSGRGAFTREILRRMAPGSSLDVCEIKKEYNHWIEQLIAAHPEHRVQLHNQCVTRFLQENRDFDVIISSLPLKNFERMKDGNVFLNAVLTGFHNGLKEGGHYLQYQYFRSNLSDIERAFGKTVDAVSFVPLNILPAFVYHMTKRRMA
jgi:phospholipid N-methyltransferase